MGKGPGVRGTRCKIEGRHPWQLQAIWVSDVLSWPQKALKGPKTGQVSLLMAVAAIWHLGFQPYPFPFHMFFVLPVWAPEGNLFARL